MRVDYDKDQLAYALANALKERDEAREERDKLQVMRKEVVSANKGAKINAQVSNSLAGKLNQAERERDEAREALKHIEEYGTEEINAAVELRQKLASALVERDEAREALRTAVQERHDFHWQLLDAVRERDEARDIGEKLSKQGLEMMDENRTLKRERDEVREELEEEKKFHHRTHMELVQTQCKVLDLTQAIIATLEENRHLADGDDCTLAKLKSEVPEWK